MTKGIRIFNARRGLAANSSSSHSILLSSNKLKDNYCDGGNFGWQNFVAASPEMKSLYLGIALSNALYDTIPHSESLIATINSLMGRKSGLKLDKENGGVKGYIDHQSVFTFPCAFGTNFPNADFVREFTNFIMQDEISILGGNDNKEEDSDRQLLPIPRDDCSIDWTCRKDKKYNYWVLFNRRTGCKIRFDFVNDIEKMKQVPDRSSFPELVDVKITNRCPYADTSKGCSQFCYQSSTLDGQHMDKNLIWGLARTLGDVGVFEAAIGGGEPTCHPEFINVLREFKGCGIIPNFTTRNLSWLYDDEQRIPILENCGCFAYSIRNSDDVIKLGKIVNKYDISRDQASVQMVMGSVADYEFRYILNRCNEQNLRINLLGFKKTGKGSNFKPRDYSNWLKIIQEKENFNPDICIDTQLAEEYEKELKENGYPSWSFHVKEGKFSCYIDAVSGKVGPSSYCKESELIDLDINSDKWPYNLDKVLLKVFETF